MSFKIIWNIILKCLYVVIMGALLRGKKKKWCMLFDHEPNTAWVVELERKKAFKINFILFFNAYDIYYSCKM